MENAIKVTVIDAEVIERGGTFEGNNGEQISYTTRKQKGKLETGGFAYPFDIRLEDGQRPYAVGEYDLDVAAMAQVNKGVLSLSKFTILRPGKAVAKAA